MSNRTIGMWLYTNSGGDKIAKKIIKKLKDRDIDTIDNINLRNAIAKNGLQRCLDSGYSYDDLARKLIYEINEIE